jgi:hypothetical protein
MYPCFYSSEPTTLSNDVGRFPILALFGHADCIERCPVLGVKRKTSARREYFAF